MRTIAALFSLVLFASGCGKEEPIPAETAATEMEAPVEAPSPLPTPEEWRAAFESSFTAKSVTDEGDGVTTFSACFNDESSRCENFSFGKRDAFRKVWHFIPGLFSSSAVGNYLVSYIAVPQNGAPNILLAPVTFSTDTLLGIERVAIMVDGEVVMEQDIPPGSVKREDYPAGVKERADFIASEEQIDALRKIRPDSAIIVRISGRRSYTTVDQDKLEGMRDEIINLLAIYDRISAATKDKLPPQ